MMHHPLIGTPQDRVDGRAKVTGTARYVADFETGAEVLHAHVLNSAIAIGRIRRIDTTRALAVPGVVEVFTHENRPRTAWFSSSYKDDVGPPGKPLRPLYDSSISYSGEPVALVVAESYETARYAANLVEVEYEAKPHETDLLKQLPNSYVPKKRRSGINPPPRPKGSAASALESAPVKHVARYLIAAEHHNPMEMHATTVIREADGKLLIHDKIQGVYASKQYVCSVFGLSEDKVRVVSPFIGGAFGSGLRPHYQLFLAVMAAMALERSVKLVLTRDQQFTIAHRPETWNEVALGAKPDGTLTAIRHKAIGSTSRYEDHQEAVVNWTNLLYSAPDVQLEYELVQLDIETPTDMRAPGAPLGAFAAESAMDELAEKLGVDPLALRLHNDTQTDEVMNKYHTSKELRAACQLGAERFGWRHRPFAPRSMRQGRELIGWGLAFGAWEAQMQKHAARVMLDAEGHCTVGVATADLGTGTYTILAQIAAEALGLSMNKVTVLLGDSALPQAPVSGGSWTAASAGSAVHDACARLKAELLLAAQTQRGSPLVDAKLEEVMFDRERIVLMRDPMRAVSLQAAFAAGGRPRIVADGQAGPDQLTQLRYSSHTHSAVFVEARVDEELGQVRVTRAVSAVAAGRILNPKTARSQVVGGVVWGIGMALHEEAMADHNLGRWMNHNIAEYHIPAHADIHEIDVIFAEEKDMLTSPLGVKGLGEIGIVGTAAAVANAVWHATGRRVRELPMTIDKVLGLTPAHTEAR
ncbi:xanthine dehydrogenase family protein molybdopterin-binding subunit [Sabulicella glaciei]|uniref:Xanthine dehydrogenase family protein molybdopterin-binding subunit n=1 Tax=Sabulicella glaciei TaxID=2984948 RepID=A0ABT3NVD1_9PROT|nr:xanthine dehydrogenase family protein molybdopterin-binding subunit [Roseococcus sp. MDT2-1-1]MCW8085509.1 xanthine dehydrogenase family protein molybdopterin-binding subunit [Roseococcus sp. MDT2-1-1]